MGSIDEGSIECAARCGAHVLYGVVLHGATWEWCCMRRWSGVVSAEACKWCCMLWCHMEWCMDLALRGGHIEIHIDIISNLRTR